VIDPTDLRRAAPSLLPGLAAVGVFLVWASAQGGYSPVHWYPGALYFLGLLAVVLVAYPGARTGIPRLLVGAIASLAAFALWSYLSIAWAEVPGDAWDGANRTLLYVTVYALFALVPWRTGAAVSVLGAHTLGVAAVGVFELLQSRGAADAHRFFVDARFSDPVGYPNGNVALWLIAFWPAVLLAARPEVPALLRSAALAAGGLLLQLAVLGQSRGSILAFPVALVLYVAVVPGRLRSLLALGATGLATLLILDPLLDVYNATGDAARLHSALGTAVGAMLVSGLCLFAAGLGWAFAEDRVTVPERVHRRLAQAALAAGAVAAAAATVVALATVGNPATWLSDRWDEFTTTDTPTFETGRFSLEAGSDRYDFWRVAVLAFRDHPLAGIGSENFATEYVRERKSAEEPLYAHSLPLGILSQTGIVGTALALAFVGFAIVAALGARRAQDPLVRAIVAAAVVSFAYWALHGSVDWFWELPALAAPALAWLGLAGGLARTAAPDPVAVAGSPRLSGIVAPAAAALGVLAAIFAVASYAMPWLSAREVEVAAGIWRDHPTDAYARLDRARSLNPLSDRADLVAGAIAARRDERPRMREAFLRAVARNPNGWYAHMELAIVAALDGQREEALEHLRRARTLNPSEPALVLLGTRVRRGQPVSVQALNRLFLQRVEERTS
jgi:hypothetical protein